MIWNSSFYMHSAGGNKNSKWSELRQLLLDVDTWVQRLINLEIPVLVRSLKSNNVKFGYYLGRRLFK